MPGRGSGVGSTHFRVLQPGPHARTGKAGACPRDRNRRDTEGTSMSVWWFILLFLVPWCVGGG